MLRATGLLFTGFFITAVVASQILGVPLFLIVVESGSMQPTMERGDAVVVLPDVLIERDYGPGDVIVFDDVTLEESGPTTHRIVEETENGFITQGDNNPVTDQAGKEPPVTRNRVLGYVPEPGGSPIIIPGVGSAVLYLQQAAAVNPARLVAVGVMLVVLGVVTPYFRSRRYERDTTRQAGLRPRFLIPVLATFIVIVATVTMTLPAGPGAIAIQAVAGEPSSDGMYRTGQTASITYRYDNRGYVPVVVVLESSGGIVEPSDGGVYVGPRDETTRNLSIDVPREPGRYQLTITEHRYLLVLPPSLLLALHDIDPLLAIAAIDLTIAIGVAGVLVLLVGWAPVRTRSRTTPPVRVRVRRWLDAMRGRK